MKLASIAFRNISRNRRRSVLSGTAIGLATLVIVFMFSYIGGIKTDMAQNAFIYDSGHIRIRHKDYDRFETLNPLHLGVTSYRNVITSLEPVENVCLVLPRIRFGTAIYRKEENYRGLGMGIDFSREVRLNGNKERKTVTETQYNRMSGEQRMEAFASSWDLTQFEGKIPEAGTRQILLAVGLAEELGLGIGDKVTFYTKTAYMGMQAWTFQVAGIVRFPIQGLNQQLFLAPLDSVQRFLKMDSAGDSVTDILIYLEDQAKLKETAQRVADALKAEGFADLVVQPWTSVGMSYAWMQMAEQIYNFVALFFFILGSTVIVNTTMMVIYERMKEIGTVAAMGMTGGEIMKLFFLEAFFISLMASFIGTAIGIGITIIFSVHGIDLSAALGGTDLTISPIIYPVLNIQSTVFVFLYSVAVASLASLLPTRKAAKIEPVEALRAT